MNIVYSVIIPAYNEEKLLPKTLSVLKKTMQSINISGEIIVVDNNSTDNTGKIALAHGVRVIFEPVNQISRARNTGAKAAKGIYFIFLDADTFLSPIILKTALDNLNKGLCCGGGIQIRFDKKQPKLVQIVVDLWNWLSLKFNLAAGCFIYCLRDAFYNVNGFSNKVYAGEEVWFSYHVQKWGRKNNMNFCIITDPCIITSDRKLEWFSPYQNLLMLIAIALMPFIASFRKLCPIWYKRPSGKK